MRLVRLFHTVRHLKLRQILGRIIFHLTRPKPDVSPAPVVWAAPGQWVPSVLRKQSLLAPTVFQFLNESREIATSDAWNASDCTKLWLYNLHYFDDLNAVGAKGRHTWHASLLNRWISENSPGQGNGWEPYPTSLRVVNWVKWAWAGHDLPDVFLGSLATQVRWLVKRMEWHLLGNHLFANAKALVFAGLFFSGDEAAAWLNQGLSIVSQQLHEQVLSDGGNFERSPMYHAIFLEDVLDLVNAASLSAGRVSATDSSDWRNVGEKMLLWLEGMTHPDGELAFFNDAAIGIAPNLGALRLYAQRLGLASRQFLPKSTLHVQHWAESGYVRISAGQAVALLDVAPIGPDYLPGHAHADTLSFELSVFKNRVVVNGGTSCYGTGAERLRERQTVAHSTVEVAGQSSSEMWSGFRVARRAYPFDLHVDSDAVHAQVSCSHDGYKRLSGHPIHRRQWAMSAGGLTVRDSVTVGALPAVARYLLHPDVRLTAVGDNAWTLGLVSGQSLHVRVVVGVAVVEPGKYAPEFGVVQPTQCLAVTLKEGQAQTQWTWA